MPRFRTYTTIVALVAAVVADAHLRKNSAEEQVQVASLKANVTKNPCAAWLQWVSTQTPAVVAAAGPPPCPCLVTPAPLMSPQEAQVTQVAAAADNAMLKGITQIQDAAVGAAAPVLDEMKALDKKEVAVAAEGAFGAAEDNQTVALKTMLSSEKARQSKEMADMQTGANMVAQLSATHLRQTAEQWAENQAQNAVSMALNGTMHIAMQEADQTALIRQEATELTKGAIQSAAQSLAVAKKAQDAIAFAPDEQVKAAKKFGKESAAEQAVLNTKMEAVEAQSRKIALYASEAYQRAGRTLREANEAEKVARESLETARENSLKIEKLKLRAQKVSSKANKAKERYLESLH